MSDPKYIGQTGTTADLITELEPVERWDTTNGWTTDRRFRGRKDMLKAKAFDLISAGGGILNMSFSPEDEPWFLLTASYGVLVGGGGGGTTDPANQLTHVWSWKPLELNKDLYSLPAIRAQWVRADLNDDNRVFAKVYLKYLIDAYLRGETQLPDPTNPGNFLPFSLDIVKQQVLLIGMDWPVWRGLIGTIGEGVADWIYSSVSFRRVSTVGANVNFFGSMNGVNKIWTTSRFYSDEGVPSNIKFVPPSTGYWLKKSPEGDQQANGQWVITQEWWYGEDYSQFIYGTPFS